MIYLIYFLLILLIAAGTISLALYLITLKMKRNYKHEKNTSMENVAEQPRKLTAEEVFPRLLKDYKSRGETIKKLEAEILAMRAKIEGQDAVINKLKSLEPGEARSIKRDLKEKEYISQITRENTNLRSKNRRLSEQNSRIINELILLKNKSTV